MYFLPLAGLAALVTWYSWPVPRARYWVGLMMISFVLSVVWWSVGGVHPAVFGAATDFIVALIMLRYAKTTYELWILRAIGAMILVDVFQQFGAIPMHEIYAITLEALNYAVLIFIGFWGSSERVPSGGRLHSGRLHGGRLRAVHRYFGRTAVYPRWWRVEG